MVWFKGYVLRKEAVLHGETMLHHPKNAALLRASKKSFQQQDFLSSSLTTQMKQQRQHVAHPPQAGKLKKNSWKQHVRCSLVSLAPTKK